jgi:hypothetical protein
MQKCFLLLTITTLRKHTDEEMQDLNRQKARFNLSYRMLNLPIEFRLIDLHLEQIPKELLCEGQWDS